MGRTAKRIAPQLVTLAALVLLVTIFFPNFISVTYDGTRFVGPLVDVLKRSAPVALLAVGMTLVIATRGIDLSVGTVMAISGAAGAWAITSDFGLWASLMIALAAGLAAGLWNGCLVALVGIQQALAIGLQGGLHGLDQAPRIDLGLAQRTGRHVVAGVLEGVLEHAGNLAIGHL